MPSLHAEQLTADLTSMLHGTTVSRPDRILPPGCGRAGFGGAPEVAASNPFRRLPTADVSALQSHQALCTHGPLTDIASSPPGHGGMVSPSSLSATSPFDRN